MDGSSAPAIIDISSDDDEDLLPDIRGIDKDYDWISEMFPEDEREIEKDGYDSDDVVVMGEVLGNPKKMKVLYDEEDDCVVLEGDPDKPVVVESGGGRDEEDLVIIGEKGQIACRDYPHARHLCAKLLFASTPHEQHCHQCHCYVCDSLAPCIYWGNGSSNTDHCHSTDQDPLWKAQRKIFRQGNKAPLPLQLSYTSLLPPPSRTVPVSASTPDLNHIKNGLSASRACTPSTNSSISNLTIRQRSHRAVGTFPTNKFNPSLVSQQLQSPSSNNANQHVGLQTLGNLGAQYMNRPSIFKRQGSYRVAQPNSPFGHGSIKNNYVPQYSRNPHL